MCHQHISSINMMQVENRYQYIIMSSSQLSSINWKNSRSRLHKICCGPMYLLCIDREAAKKDYYYSIFSSQRNLIAACGLHNHATSGQKLYPLYASVKKYFDSKFEIVPDLADKSTCINLQSFLKLVVSLFTHSFSGTTSETIADKVITSYNERHTLSKSRRINL